jgi:hypothetical protein
VDAFAEKGTLQVKKPGKTANNTALVMPTEAA